MKINDQGNTEFRQSAQSGTHKMQEMRPQSVSYSQASVRCMWIWKIEKDQRIHLADKERTQGKAEITGISKSAGFINVAES